MLIHYGLHDGKPIRSRESGLACEIRSLRSDSSRMLRYSLQYDTNTNLHRYFVDDQTYSPWKSSNSNFIRQLGDPYFYCVLRNNWYLPKVHVVKTSGFAKWMEKQT